MARTMAAGAFLVAALGLLVATLTMPAHGASHHCPPDAPRSACFYPPDRGLHLGLWIAAGLLAGLLLGRLAVALWVAIGRVRRTG